MVVSGADALVTEKATHGEPTLGQLVSEVVDVLDEHRDSTLIADLTEVFYEVENEDEFDEGPVPTDDYEHVDIGKIDFNLFKVVWNQRSLILRDKLTFLLGSTELWLCAYWLGRWPEKFYRLYTVQALVLGGLRWVTYRRRGWHYYLFDFCYYANFLLLLHLWLYPSSAFLQRTLFAYSNGPLAWSILAFRNSLVYHDMDKVTSLFMHLVPVMVSWTLRWFPDQERFRFPTKHADGSVTFSNDAGKAGVLELVAVPMVPYLLWAVLYYLKIFVISAKKIQQRNYATLFKYVTGTPTKKTAFSRVARHVPPRLQPVVYLGLHLVFSLSTFCLSMVFWHSYELHTSFLAVMCSLSIWHGATFYFDVFAKKYLAAVAARVAAEQEPEHSNGRVASTDKKGS